MTMRVAMAELPGVWEKRSQEQRRSVVLMLHEAALLGLHRIQESIAATVPFPPVDKGFYQASHHVARDADGATVYTDCPYAAEIEYGARPHWPPSGPIYQWAYRKFRVSLQSEWRGAGGKRKTGLTSREFREREARSIAFLVCRAISRRGMKPRLVYAHALPGMQMDVRRLLDRLHGEPGFKP